MYTELLVVVSIPQVHAGSEASQCDTKRLQNLVILNKTSRGSSSLRQRKWILSSVSLVAQNHLCVLLDSV